MTKPKSPTVTKIIFKTWKTLKYNFACVISEGARCTINEHFPGRECETRKMWSKFWVPGQNVCVNANSETERVLLNPLSMIFLGQIRKRCEESFLCKILSNYFCKIFMLRCSVSQEFEEKNDFVAPCCPLCPLGDLAHKFPQTFNILISTVLCTNIQLHKNFFIYSVFFFSNNCTRPCVLISCLQFRFKTNWLKWQHLNTRE